MLEVLTPLLVLLLVASAALHMLRHSRGLSRLYWLLCSLLLWGGLISVIGLMIWPPEHYDEVGRLIGEMPPEFGIAVFMIQLGLFGAVTGFVLNAAVRLGRWAWRVWRF